MNATNQQVPHNRLEEDLRSCISQTKILAQELNKEKQRREISDSKLYRANEKINKLEADNLYKHRVGSIAGESTGVFAGSGVIVGGAFLSFIFPPVGIVMLIAGVIGTITSSVFLGIDSAKEAKINNILSVHSDLTYKQASDIVDNEYIELEDSEGKIFRYTSTHRMQITLQGDT